MKIKNMLILGLMLLIGTSAQVMNAVCPPMSMTLPNGGCVDPFTGITINAPKGQYYTGIFVPGQPGFPGHYESCNSGLIRGLTSDGGVAIGQSACRRINTTEQTAANAATDQAMAAANNKCNKSGGTGLDRRDGTNNYWLGCKCPAHMYEKNGECHVDINEAACVKAGLSWNPRSTVPPFAIRKGCFDQKAPGFYSGDNTKPINAPVGQYYQPYFSPNPSDLRNINSGKYQPCSSGFDTMHTSDGGVVIGLAACRLINAAEQAAANAKTDKDMAAANALCNASGGIGMNSRSGTTQIWGGCKCPAGASGKTGQCVCPVGKSLKNGQCVCNDGTVLNSDGQCVSPQTLCDQQGRSWLSYSGECVDNCCLNKSDEEQCTTASDCKGSCKRKNDGKACDWFSGKGGGCECRNAREDCPNCPSDMYWSRGY